MCVYCVYNLFYNITLKEHHITSEVYVHAPQFLLRLEMFVLFEQKTSTWNQRVKKVIDVEFSGEEDLEAVAKAFELLGRRCSPLPKKDD